MSTPDNRSVNFFSLFCRGQHYSKTWPLEKRLAPVFVENRVIKMTRYAIRFMPPIAQAMVVGTDQTTICCLTSETPIMRLTTQNRLSLK